MRRQARRSGVVVAVFAMVALVSGSAVPARGAGEAVKNPDVFVEQRTGDVVSLDPALA